MARMLARCSAFACVAVHALAAAPLPLTDLEAAVSAEGAACSSLSSTEDSCQLHLLQVRARGLSEEAASDSPSEQEAAGQPEVVKPVSKADEAIEAMRLDDFAVPEDEAAEVAEASEVAPQEQQEAIEAMRLDDFAVPEGEVAEGILSAEQGLGDEHQEEASSVGMEASAVDEPIIKEEALSVGMEASAVDEPVIKAAQGPEVGSLKTATVVAESAGHCTLQDTAAMQQMGRNAFPKAVADCGRSAYKWFRFHPDAMEQCVRSKAGLSAPCAQCFAAAGQYGFDNCKVQCLFGSWCSSLCRGCTSAFDHVTQECVGSVLPQPDTC